MPTVSGMSFEDEDSGGFTVRYVAKDNAELAAACVELLKDETVVLTKEEMLAGRKTGEVSFRYSYPEEAEGEETYTARVTVTDAAGHSSGAALFGQTVIRNDANALPKDYFHNQDSWEYVVYGDGRAYITGPSDPETAAAVTRLLPSDFPTEVTLNGIRYAVAGTTQAEDPAHSFAALTNLKEIVGFPKNPEYSYIGGFKNCPALQKVTLNTYYIQARAFEGCTNLSDVEMGYYLAVIEEDAFANCPKLTRIRTATTKDIWEERVDVAGTLPDLFFRWDVEAACSADTSDRKLGVITASFTNNGYLGDASYWSNPRIWVEDESGAHIGEVYGNMLDVKGKSCTVSFDVGSETLGKTFEPQYDTTYRYHVLIDCSDQTVGSPIYEYHTASAAEAPNPIQYITLNYRGTTLSKGDSLWLYRYLHPGDAKNRDVTWTSSAPSVVSVENGKITALKAGTATITCQATDPLANGAKAICSVRVTEECASCSSSYSGWYRVKGTPGNLAISSTHAASTSSGASELGKIPEGTIVQITKATGYNGHGSSSGHFGHVSYNGISGFCAMNYLEKISSTTVALDLNGGTTTDSFYQEDGQPVLRVTLWEGGYANSNVVTRIPVRTGYTFLGWNTNAAGTGKMVYDASGMSTVDGDWWKAGDGGSDWPVWGGKPISKLYAAWKPNQYTITFDPDAGSCAVFSQEMTYGTTANNTAPIPAKAGYAFEGWYTDGNTMMFGADGKWNPEATWYFASDGKWQRDLEVTVHARWVTTDTKPPVIRDVSIAQKSAEGYLVVFTAEDDVAIKTAYVESWTEAEGEANAVRSYVGFWNNNPNAWVSAAQHGGAVGVPYTTRIVVWDAAGNEDVRVLSDDNAVYVDAQAPVLLDTRISELKEDGVRLEVDAEDDEQIASIRCLVWEDGTTPPDEDEWDNAIQFEMFEDAQWTLYVPLLSSRGVSNVWNVAIRAWDISGNISLERLLTVNTAEAETAPSEDLSFTAFGDHVYILLTPVSRPVSGADAATVWEASETLCESFGGHLIRIDSKAENDFAATLAKEYGAPVWIGASKEGGWKWTDGSRLSFESWESGQPTNAAYAALQPDGKWIGGAETANRLYGFICEVDKGILSLPKATKNVGDRAFYGNTAQIVVIPEKCEEIGSEAFADAKRLLYVILPDAYVRTEEDSFGDADVRYLIP